MSVRIVLDNDDFRQLVEGGVVVQYPPGETLNIVLEDIGFAMMRHHIDNAERRKSYAEEGATGSQAPTEANPKSEPH